MYHRFLNRAGRGILGGLAFLVSLLVGQTVYAADDTISQVPLYLSTSTVYPNVMFVLDDSGSMQWEFMPDQTMFFTTYTFPRPSAIYGSSDVYTSQVPDFNDSNLHNVFSRSPQNNAVFYNPDVDYRSWATHTDTPMANASPTAAPYNPADLTRGTMNLTAQQTQSAYWFRNITNLNQGQAFYTCGPPCNQSFWPMTFYMYKGVGDRVNPASYVKYQIRGTNAFRRDLAGGSETSVSSFVWPSGKARTVLQERQNFANWFTYYRSRILSARAGIGQAFSQQDDNMRVGFGAINNGSSTIDGVANTPAIVRGVRQFEGANRQGFFSDLYEHPIGTSGTPLRRALQAAGQYYSRSDNRGPWGNSPGVNDSTPHLECRSSYTILMTDGFWNGSNPNPSVSNADNASGPTIAGPGTQSYQYTPADPYRDEHSDTLADVAMHYWKRDLRTIPNRVPTTSQNEAFWQHMVTFGVGLGVEGSVDVDDAWAAAANGDAIVWPDPYTTNVGKLDDLLHAGLNSRGGFFSAQDPETFAEELSGVLQEIGSRQNAAVAVATNSTRVQEETLAVQARFDSENWTGELIGARLGPDGKQEAELWRATDPGKIPAHGSRSIFTFDDVADAVRPFLAGSLSTAMKEQLVDATHLDFANEVVRLVNYLRGDVSNEQRNGGGYRNRESLLGDILNSDPAVSAQRNYGWFDIPAADGGGYTGNGSYGDYLNNIKPNRETTVYVGANDGMLHAFREDGREFFGYIPQAVFSNLPELADPDYTHLYYVDGSPVIGDAYNGGWKTVLVGTTGAGGKGVFAIDVSNAPNLNASSVLWDISDGSGSDFEDDLGHTLGTPLIDRLEDGTWVAIFANGYNSNDKKAVLYVVDLFSGQLIQKLDTLAGSDANPNGLSSPFVVPDLTGQYAKFVFAGDLHGNMWKFILPTTVSGTDGEVAFSGDPLFTTRTPGNNYTTQSITAAPDVSYHPNGGYLVLFGTGRFFSPNDQFQASPPVDTFYGIRDNGAPVTLGNNVNSRTTVLQEQTISNAREVTANGTTREIRDISTTAMDWASKDGWFIDLRVGTNAADARGERVVKKPITTLGRVFFATYEPSDDPCVPDGVSRLYQVGALSGGAMLSLPEQFQENGEDACPAGGHCGGIELAAGAPLSPPVVTTERLRTNPDGTVTRTGDQTLSILLPDGEVIDSLEVARIRTGRLRWRQLIP